MGNCLISDLVAETISAAMLDASSELYNWSRGRILYECGAESILATYCARALYKRFSADEAFYIELEARTKDLLKGGNVSDKFRKGRIDLYSYFGNENIQFIIEFKRYLSLEFVRKDILRLAEIVSLSSKDEVKTIGILAAVMYQYKDHNYSYLGSYANEIQSLYGQFADVEVMTIEGDCRNLPILPRLRHKSKRDRHFSVITVLEAK